MSFRLAVPVIFDALTVCPMEAKTLQQATAARLFPEFIDVPQTRIIRDLGVFFEHDFGFMSGKDRVFKTLPS